MFVEFVWSMDTNIEFVRLLVALCLDSLDGRVSSCLAHRCSIVVTTSTSGWMENLASLQLNPLGSHSELRSELFLSDLPVSGSIATQDGLPCRAMFS